MSQKKAKDSMEAIRLTSYQHNLIKALKGLEYQQIPIPSPGRGELLVKIEASPCNPSDIAFIRGLYNIKKEIPVTAGFEACGRVVSCGEGIDENRFSGKRVSFYIAGKNDGSWAEYACCREEECILVDEALAMEQAACFAINPFTALALVQLIDKDKHHAVIQNAAAGQVGSFVRKLCRMEGIPLINIVRKEEQALQLREEGEENVLVSGSGFEDELKSMATAMNALLAFDAVGGDASGTIINAMPENAELLVYGGLGGQKAGNIEVLDLIFKNKSIRGFNLNEWKRKQGKQDFESASKELQQLFIKGKLQTKIHKTFPLNKAVKALLTYAGNMSAGKVLFQAKQNNG